MDPATRRRPIDRLAAPLALLVAAGVLFATIALSDAAAPLTARHDPRAAAELIALMKAGEHATYVAQYTFTRVEPNGQRSSSTQRAAHAPAGTVTRTDANLSIVWKGRATDCALVDGKPACFAQAAPTGLPESEVLQVAVRTGIYDVTPAPAATIAGELGRCFVVRAHVLNKQLPNDFGAESDLCYASDGVPLRTRLYSDRLDELEATRVTRVFDDASLAPVLAGFDRTAPAITR